MSCTRNGRLVGAWVVAASAVSALATGCCSSRSCDAPATPAPAAAGDAASQLNGMCPDLWCEGDWRYVFRSVDCTPGGCRVAFDATSGSRAVNDAIDVPGVAAALDREGSISQTFERRFGEALLQWEARAAPP